MKKAGKLGLLFSLIGTVGMTTLANADTLEESKKITVATVQVGATEGKQVPAYNGDLATSSLGFEILSNKSAEPEPEYHVAMREEAKKERERLAEEEALKEEERLRVEAEKNWESNFPIVNGNSATASFVNQISKEAVEIARKHNIFPSVLLAQAAHESANGKSGLGAAPYYNLFGIKGSYKGQSVSFATGEEYGGSYVTIQASFRKYNSWSESMDDYASLFSGGLTGNPGFYSGTWRSNSSNYAQATASLMGKYATDSSYAPKLNSTIQQFQLDRFDAVEKLDLDAIKVERVVKDEIIPDDIHVVSESESLRALAFRYETTPEALVELNNLENAVLFVNQRIQIPKKESVDNETKASILKTLEVVKNTADSTGRLATK